MSTAFLTTAVDAGRGVLQKRYTVARERPETPGIVGAVRMVGSGVTVFVMT
jgi:hypothetical protein